MKKIIVAVVGHDKNVEEIHLKIAEEVGKEIAKRNGIVLCGGMYRGVANSSAKGAKSENGLTVGIIPGNDLSEVSEFIDIPILTGMGFARNQIISFSCDVMIAIGGGVGTLCEMAYAYAYSKPIIVIQELEGLPEGFIGKYMDDKKTVKIIGAKNAKEAVDLAFKMVK